MAKRKFLLSMHYFRAFAIVNIVFAHTIMIPEGWDISDNVELLMLSSTRKMLFHDSTIYFIFISGFLFHYLSNSFNTKKYYLSKIKNVISPYIVCTVIIYLIKCYASASSFSFPVLQHHLLNGTVAIPYWYIPFISVVFLISPLFLRLNRTVSTWVCLIACVLPLLGTRSGTHLTWGGFLYFVPVYMLGILSSINYDKVLELCRKNKVILLFGLVGTSVSLEYLLYNRIYIFYGRINLIESIFYVQKLSATFLIILLFTMLKKEHMLLNLFANLSFGLYFTHTVLHRPSVLRDLLEITEKYIPATVIIVGYAVFSMFLTLSVLVVLKRILGKRSRMLLGI